MADKFCVECGTARRSVAPFCADCGGQYDNTPEPTALPEPAAALQMTRPAPPPPPPTFFPSDPPPQPGRSPANAPRAPAHPQSRRMVLPQWRKGSWIILAFNLLMLVLTISAGSTGTGTQTDCQYLSAEDCNAASDVGTAIGTALIVVFWAIGDVILGVIWLVTNSAKRACPACGTGAKKGVVLCRRCGHDFRREGAHG